MRSFDELKEWDLQVKEGDTIHAYEPFLGTIGKLHIMYVLDSYYSDRKLIVYRVFGKHKQWWHEFMCDDLQLKINIDHADRIKNGS